MKFIAHENIPCWYDLGWEGGKEPAFILRIATWSLVDLVSHLRRLGELPLVNPKSRIGFKEIGFDRTGEGDDFVFYRFGLPAFSFTGKRKCFACNGKKKEGGRKCFACKGGGKDREAVPGLARKTAQAMAAVLAQLEFLEGEGACPRFQLMTPRTGVIRDRDRHAYPLSGYVSIPLAEWLGKRGVQARLPESQAAMKEANERMAGRAYGPFDGFRAWSDADGGFHMDVPGDCACIGVDRSSGHLDREVGYEFHSHNVDGAAQQLSLLAGVAAMLDLARKEMHDRRPAP